MSVISRVTVVPSRLTTLVQTLRLLEEPFDRRQVMSMLFPETLRRVELEGEATTPSASAEELLKEAEALGLISVAGVKIGLSDAGLSMADDPIGWLHTTLTDPERARTNGQGEVPSALVWLLSTNPLEGLDWQTNHRMAIQSVLGTTAGLSNLADFQQLFHWARFLGYCWWTRAKSGIRVIPDPTAAIESAVDRGAIPHAKRLHVLQFIDLLGTACPVLEGGAARSALADRLSDSPGGGRSAGHFSSSTGLALERLAATGRAVIEATADADSMVAGPPGTTSRRISHITLHGASS